MDNRWRWLRSAGGLGGLRVYAHPVVCATVMIAWSYPRRGLDEPVLQLALVLAAPYYVLVGFWFARRRSDEAGVVVGAVTAVLSFLILDLAAVAYSAETEPWPKPLVWLGLGISMTIVTATLGALCGLLGAAISHSPLIRRFLHDP